MIDDTNDTTGGELSAEEMALDARVTQLAQSYHRPPDIVPANEMWARISATRTVASQPARRHTAIWVLAASAAFLAIGIGIGRGWRPSQSAASHTVPRVATTPTPPTNVGARLAVPVPVNDRTPDAVGPRPAVPVNHGTSVAVATPHPAPVDTRTPSDVGNSTAYQLATVRHFTEVEALLTSFQSGKRDAKADQQLATWGRSLLGQTRLLLDSPAANDPARRRLLQDLELVLVQITQLSPSTVPVERDMIDGAVRTSDVIPRLRTAVPAGGATHFNGA